MNPIGYDTGTDDDPTGDESDMKAHKRWVQEIKYYEKLAKPWEDKSRKILKRYKDDRGTRDYNARYNILWSNIQTLLPALISRTPKPDIERRFRDQDDVGRFTSSCLERSISYFINDTFMQGMRQCVLDRLLSGRGTMWVRYEPHFQDADIEGTQEEKDDGTEITDNAEAYGDDTGGTDSTPDSSEADEEGEPVQEIADEAVCYDYVHYKDFGHTAGRTWDEIGAIWRKVYMSREAGIERFGEIFKDVPLDYNPTDAKDNKVDEVIKKLYNSVR